jgi:hypothetical protein
MMTPDGPLDGLVRAIERVEEQDRLCGSSSIRADVSACDTW